MQRKTAPRRQEDVFRFKFHGLFYVAPAQDSFMLRLRIPGGKLTAHQMRGLAEMAEAWGSGRADLTTRANIQIREFQPKDIVRVLNKVQSLGLSSRGSGADNIRNITASPTTGLDPTELLDVAPYAEASAPLHSQLARSVRTPAEIQCRLRQWRSRSAWWPIPMTLDSRRCALARDAAFRPAFTSGWSCAASPATSSLRLTAGSL